MIEHDFAIRGITREHTPWGYYETLFTRNNHGVRGYDDAYKVKILFVRKGHRTSLQRHSDRQEIWTVVDGNPLVTRGSIDFILSPGESIKVGKGEKHRIEADIDDVIISEVQLGACQEDDIERIEDDYDRIK
jgi:mannose-6-phosphate isomerase-like protein (cupin superfamily)